MMLSPFVWGRNGEALTPDQVAALRELADAQRGKMGDTSPVGHWTAGAARVVDALGGVLKERRADKAEAAGMASADDAISGNPVLSALIGGGSSQPGNAMAPGTLQPASDNPYRDAIASIESDGSGGYAAIGPTHPKMGRALGRYQIMEANLPGWSQAALGRPVSADEFMANPDIQDAIFDHQFGGYVEKYGPEGAAQAWLGGPGGVGQVDRKDSLGTSIGDYGARFTKALGGSYGQPPQQDAGVIAALAKAAADPWVQKKYGPVIDALMGNEMKRQNAQYEQQLAQSDPMYKAQLAKLTAPEPVDPWAGMKVINGQVVRMGENGPESIGDFNPPQKPEIPTTKNVTLSDGSEVMVQWNPQTQVWDAANIPEGGTGGTGQRTKLTEGQAKTTMFGQMQKETAPILNQIEEIWNPANMPDALARTAPIGGNFFTSEQGQIYKSAASAWAEGALRLATGAAAQPSEIDRLMETYFAKSGDTPTVVAFKRGMRDMYSRAIEASLGDDPGAGTLELPQDFAERYQSGQGAAPPAVDASDPAYQAFITDPKIIAAAKKYGVTPDEMWATKNGGGQ